MRLNRILVVDDEPQSRRTLRSMLAAQGYEVHVAHTGEPALHCLQSNRIDLMILASNLPGSGRIKACTEVRSISEAALIILAKLDSEEEKIAVLDAGADDYLTMPFSTPELLARIRVVLRRLPKSAINELEPVQLEGLQTSLATRRVISQTRQIRLTPKEFDLLHYFIANPNLTIPHAKLLQSVWGPEYGHQVEYLRTFINQLRKKIEPDPAHPRYLLTEPWVGYRFAAPSQQFAIWR